MPLICFPMSLGSSQEPHQIPTTFFTMTKTCPGGVSSQRDDYLKGTEGRLETQQPHANNQTYFLILCIFPPPIYFFNSVTRRRDYRGKNGWKGEAVDGGGERRHRWTCIKGNIFYLAMKFHYMNG